MSDLYQLWPPASTSGLLDSAITGHADDPVLTVYSQHVPATGMWVRANMVASIDGRIAGADGKSGSISTPADKRVFSVLRALADAVVVGAGTARAERYTRLSAKPAYQDLRAARKQAPAPTLVLVSTSGNIDITRLQSAGTGPVIVHTSCQDAAVLASLRQQLGASQVVKHTTASVHPAAVLADLQARGLQQVLCEGGPQLLGEWFAAEAVDELCLTRSPVLMGAAGAGDLLGSASLPGSPVTSQLLSLLSDGNTLMSRLLIGRHNVEGSP